MINLTIPDSLSLLSRVHRAALRGDWRGAIAVHREAVAMQREERAADARARREAVPARGLGRMRNE